MSELVVHNEGGRKQKKGDIVKKGVAGVDNTSRRTWDKDEFAAKAAAREAQVISIYNVVWQSASTLVTSLTFRDNHARCFSDVEY